MIASELRRIVASQAPASAVAWLDEQRARIADPVQLRVAFAAAGRHLGTQAIGDDAAAQITRAGLPWPASAGVDECGRAALLIEAAPAHALVNDLLRRGALREQQAVLRALAALPAPASFVELAVDACRTNAQPVFEAIACDNAYPSRYFSDAAMCQLVLKALFIGAPVGRIVGLAERTTDELVRMVDAFASERRAAGRPVPDDASLIRRTS